MSILEKMGMALDSRDEAGLMTVYTMIANLRCMLPGKFCPNLKLSVGG